MSSVDKRVVEMQFKNGQFESGVKTTLSTLDKLKAALKLDNATKGMNDVNNAAKKVSLSPLEKAVDSVNSRFSTLGVIGTTALANLTNSAVNAGKKLAGALISPLVEGGKRRALNIEQAKFQFEGLGMDVEESMKSANAAVKGTAYGLDSAAKAASQMGASGMQAGENMTKALRAIAGVAAMTGSEYDDISNIFVTVAGNGRLMGDQLLQLSGRGINAAATLGKELGKSEAEIRDMVSKGLIDFETFYTAMDNAFGAHAKDANKTFEGALSNMKAALSRIGADVATPAFENLRDIFNALIPVIDNVHVALNPLIGDMAEAMKQFSEFAVGVLTNLDLSPFTDGMEKARIVLQGFKDGFVNVFRGLASVVKPIVEAFKNIFPAPTIEQANKIADAVRNLTSKLILSEPAANKVRAVFEGVFSVFKFVASILATLAKGFAGLLSVLLPIGNAALTIASGIGQAVSNLFGAISSFNALDVVITKVSKALSTFSTGLSNLISNIDLAGIVNGLSDIFGKIFKSIGDFFNDFDFSSFTASFINIFGGTAFAVIATQFGKASIAISTALTTLKQKLWSFGNIKSPASILGSVQGALQSWQQNLHASTLIKLAVAIGILSAALMLLSKIPASSLAKSLGAMTVIFAEMMLAFSAFSGALTASKLVGVGKASLAMIALATAILILSSAVKKMSGIDWKGLVKGLAGVGVALSELVIFTQYVNPKGMITAGIGMMGIASAILILSAAVSIFAKLNVKEMIVGLSAIAILLGEIVIFSKSFGKLSGLISGASLAVVATSLIILGAALKIFSSMSLKEIGKGFISIGGALAILSVSLHMMNGTLKGSAALMVAASALLALAPALRLLGSMSITQIAAALGVLAGTFAIIGGATIFISSLIPALLGLSAAIGIFGAACLAVGVGMAAFATGLATLAASGAAGATALTFVLQSLIALIPELFAALVRGLISAMDELSRASSTITSFIVTLIVSISEAIKISASHIVDAVTTVISLLLYELLGRVPEFVNAGLQMIRGVLTGIALNIRGVTALAIAVASEFIEGIAEQLPRLIQAGMDLITAFLTGLADAVDNNASKINNAVIRLFTSLFGAFAMIAGALFIVQKAQTTILLMTAVLAVVAIIIKKLAELPVESVLGIAASLSTLLISLSTAAAILQFVRPAAALTGVVGLAAVIAGLTVLFTAIGAINGLVPEIKMFVDNAVPLLQSLGNALGAFFGGIIGGVIESASAGLVGLGTNLSQFMFELEPFLNGVKNIDDSVISGIQTLALMVVSLAAADFINGINIFGSQGSSIQSLAENLPLLGKAMNEFASTIDESNAGKIQASVEAAKALAEMLAVLPREGGVFSFFTGEVDFEGLSENLPKFGEALKAYGEAVSGLDSASINSSIEGAQGIVDVANSIEKSGGLIQAFTGQVDFAGFSENLPKFGEALKSYGESVSGLDSASINASIEGAQGIVDVVNSINSSGGIFEVFTGSNDLETFAEKLPKFGEALKAYGEALKGINVSAIKKSIDPAKSLVEVANSIQSSGGFFSIFTGDNDLEDFAKKLPVFGEALKSFGDSVKGLNSASIKTSVFAAKSLVEIQNSLPESGGLFSDEKTLNDLSNQLPKLGEALKSYGESVKSINSAAIVTSVNAVKQLASMTTDIPDWGGFLGFFTGESGNIEAFANQLPVLGRALTLYSESVSKLNIGMIVASAKAISVLTEISKEIPSWGGLMGLLNGETGNIAVFAIQLPLLAQGIRSFADTVSGMDTSALDAALYAGSQLAAISNTISNWGGLLGLLNGETGNIVILSIQLPILAQGIRSFADIVSGMDTSSIGVAVQAASQLAELSSIIPSWGGLLGLITGEAGKIAAFAVQLPILGQGISDFGESVKNIDSGSIMAAVQAGIQLAQLSVIVPNWSGLLGFLTGEAGKLEAFANQLPVLGEGIASFSSAVSVGIDIGAVMTAVQAGQQLAALAAQIPSYNAIADFFLGDKITAFREGIPKIGEGIKAFGDSVAELNPSMIDTAILAGQRLVGLITLLNSTGYEQVQPYSVASATLANSLNYFAAQVAGIDYGAIESAIYWLGQVKNAMQEFPGEIDSSVLSSFVETINNAGKQTVETFVNTLNEGKSQASDAARNMINQALISASAAMTVGNSRFMNGGRLWITNLAKGMEGGRQQVLSALTSILDECVRKINDYQNRFAEAGRNIPKGVAQGIEAGKSEAINAAVRMAKESLQAAKDELAINSPSKKFAEIVGRAIPEGTASGILKYMYYATDAAREMGDSAISSVSSTLSAIDFEFNEMNLEPTITPVLDMSQVERGISRFGTEYRIPLTASSDSLRSSISKLDRQAELRSINQNGSSQTIINKTYDMTQNNYSPKPLSRIDIYRQTSNQFSRLKQIDK